MFGKCWEASRVSLVNVVNVKEGTWILAFRISQHLPRNCVRPPNIYQTFTTNTWWFWQLASNTALRRPFRICRAHLGRRLLMLSGFFLSSISGFPRRPLRYGQFCHVWGNECCKVWPWTCWDLPGRLWVTSPSVPNVFCAASDLPIRTSWNFQKRCLEHVAKFTPCSIWLLDKSLGGCMFSLWGAVIVHLAGVVRHLKFNVVQCRSRQAPGGVAVEASWEQTWFMFCPIGS